MRAPLLLVIAALGSAACRVAPPRVEDLLAVGFRTPEQTFRTFQTAVRADEPELQRRCFSSGFLAANHLSQLNWLEFWDRLKEDQPFLRKGIADAEVDGPIERAGGRARLIARSHGNTIELDFVLDDFCEVWAGSEPIVDEATRFSERAGIQETADGRRWVYAQVPLPASRPIALADVTELRVGREWKIDGIALLDEASKRSSPVTERE